MFSDYLILLPINGDSSVTATYVQLSNLLWDAQTGNFLLQSRSETRREWTPSCFFFGPFFGVGNCSKVTGIVQNTSGFEQVKERKAAQNLKQIAK